MQKGEDFAHPDAGKELIETVRTLRDIKDVGEECDREITPDGVEIILTNNQTTMNKHADDYIANLERAIADESTYYQKQQKKDSRK